jgi:uncharacterized membrane protein
MKYHALAFILIFLFGLPTIFSLVGLSYYPMHDDTQVARVVTMGRALASGQFPVRWVADLGYGYGYPLFNFYGPLPYYFGGLLFLLNIPGVIAAKVMIGAGLLLSGFTFYLLGVRKGGRLGAVAGAILYMYAPYRAVQTYVRGAIGESWVLIFLPLIFLGPWLWSQGKRAIGLLVGAVGIAGVILSHTILGYVIVLSSIFVWLAAGFVSLWQKRMVKKFVLPFIAMISIGLGLSAFFWLPAVVEMPYTNVSGQVSATADFIDHFVCPVQLWSSQWGFGGSAKGCIDGISFMIGKLHLMLALTGLLVICFSKKNRSVLSLGILLLTVSIFFMLDISKSVWAILPGFKYIQYPWRFLSIAAFGTALVGSSLIGSLREKRWRFVGFLAVSVGSILLYVKWFHPQYLYYQPAAFFESPQEIRGRASRVSDEYLPATFVRPENPSDVFHDTIIQSPTLSVHVISDTGTQSQYRIQNQVAQEVRINRVFFPGWKYLVNGDQVRPNIVDSLPYLWIPVGESTVTLTFVNTPVRIVGDSMTLVSILLFIYIYLYAKKTIA